MTGFDYWKEFVDLQQDAIAKAFSRLHSMRNSESFDADLAVKEIELITSIELALSSLVSKPSSDSSHLVAPAEVPSNSEQILDLLHNLRLRMAAAAASYCSLNQIGIESEDSRQESLRTLINRPPAVESYRGSIAAARIKRAIILLLPEMVGIKNESNIAHGLLDVFEHTPHGYDWIIDFSAVKEISSFFLGILYGYRESLSLHGACLSVCWLPISLIPPTHETGLVEKLRLVKVGGYWFSQGRC